MLLQSVEKYSISTCILKKNIFSNSIFNLIISRMKIWRNFQNEDINVLYSQKYKHILIFPDTSIKTTENSLHFMHETNVTLCVTPPHTHKKKPTENETTQLLKVILPWLIFKLRISRLIFLPVVSCVTLCKFLNIYV